MIHPLFRLIASEPQMLADHVEAYADLVSEEVGAATMRLKRRLLLQALSVFGIALAVVLAGVAVMLWAVVPTQNMQAPWVLVLVPAAPALLAGWCHFFAKVPEDDSHGMKAIREQLAADAAMLRSVSAP
jgi:fatty acid desaturase